MNKTTTAISDADIAAFREDGAVCLRGVIDADWIEALREGVAENLATPGPYTKGYSPDGAVGRFTGDYCNWQRIEAYRRFAFEGPLAAIAGRAMGAERVQFFHEHMLVKEPGAAERTPWHHDQPYWCVDGVQICSTWVPLDPVPRDTAVEYVAGSHRWGHWFAPKRFVDGNDHAADSAFEPVPDIDAMRDSHRILGWATEPGDCILFHALTLHGAPGNRSLSTRRRAVAFRWFGDDARFARRPDVTSPPFPELTLQPGDRLDTPLFPVVWPRAEAGPAA
jgi:ectoine hydroxylase-related dioxygenase (phytanoyl-CoA dioxygenase family)